jgi:hypothetical protein
MTHSCKGPAGVGRAPVAHLPRVSALLVASCLAAACGAGTGPGSDEPRTVVIGAVIDRTGSQAWPGWIEAIRLAESHANEALAQARWKGLQLKIIHHGL